MTLRKIRIKSSFGSIRSNRDKDKNIRSEKKDKTTVTYTYIKFFTPQLAPICDEILTQHFSPTKTSSTFGRALVRPNFFFTNAKKSFDFWQRGTFWIVVCALAKIFIRPTWECAREPQATFRAMHACECEEYYFPRNFTIGVFTLPWFFRLLSEICGNLETTTRDEWEREIHRRNKSTWLDAVEKVYVLLFQAS